MSLDTLPREVINAIVGCLTSNRDLCSVSLVSSHLIPSTRPPLFSSICLSARPSFAQDELQRFVDFVSSTPHICPFIRHFTFQRMAYPMLMTVSLRVTCTEIANLLAQLPNLESLSLSGVTFDPEPYESDLRFTVKKLVLTEAAEEMAIYAALSLFESIDELTVVSVFHVGRLPRWEMDHNQSAESFEEVFTPTIAPYTAVNKLRMDVMCSHARFLTEVLRRTRTLDTITSFHLLNDGLPLEFRASHSIADFLSAAGRTITHLTLATGDRRVIHHSRIQRPLRDIEADYASEEMCAKLSALTALETVTLRLVHRGRSGPDVAEELPWFITLMSLLASLPTTVKRIELSFCNMMRSDGGRRISPAQFWNNAGIDLRKLPPMLERYPGLETVIFHKSDEFTMAEQRHVEDVLHELHGKNMIKFESYKVEFFSVRDDLM